ncbi:hypothetical protein [Rhizobium lentis]|uniref:DAC domain-containing protein n=1 Tax=Rhizobium lentis TaxID=1138194 RepID=A0A7W9CWK0_9HYPH|nr:hypothetical protein [Rhizobium lentis]MBB5551977.1 hypothetical protein [Rhizobium lentis]MBB5562515.1 hypothetical protein [Rhizobium lentis]MBB5569938.1 hypothetical protein [Rhizobium lentis]
MQIERVQELLLTVRNQATARFSGLGIIISDIPCHLPITPLRPKIQLEPSLPTVDALLKVSDQTTEYHDGFHVLSSSLQLQLISQYFSPPIAAVSFPPNDRVVGGRYAAAMFGSTLTGVIATGVVSKSYGIALFVDGTEVFVAAPNIVGSPE